MRRFVVVMLAVAGLLGASPIPVAGQGGDSVTRTFAAPMEQVWTTTESVLKSLGWDIDEKNKVQGWILTDDEKVDFKDFVLYGEGSRHRLRVQLRYLGEGRTSVSVTRELWMEKRYLWIKERKSLQAPDRNVENAVLDALERSLPVAVAPPPPAAPATPPARGEFTFKVTYVVKGTAPGAMLTYRNARGGTEQTSARLPWEMSFDVRAGDFLHISAQNESASGTVTCEILLDGVTKTTATSSGAYVTADCAHAAGRN